MSIAAILPAHSVVKTGAGPFTATAQWQNAVVVIDNADTVTVNIPDDDELSFPIGTWMYIVERGAGTVDLLVPGSDTVIGTTTTLGAGNVLLVLKIGATEWDSVKLT